MNHLSRRVLASAALLGSAAVFAGAQPRAGNQQVTASAAVAPATAKAGTAGVLTVTLSVKPGFHIYSNTPGSPDFIPTTIAGEKTPGVTWGKAQFPPAKSVTMPAMSPKPVMVYDSKAVIKLPYTLAKTTKPGKVALKATVDYQACNDKVCYPPQSLPVSAEVTVR